MLVALPPITIVVVTQINTSVGLNLAILSPGAVQTLVQTQGNAAALAQRR